MLTFSHCKKTAATQADKKGEKKCSRLEALQNSPHFDNRYKITCCTVAKPKRKPSPVKNYKQEQNIIINLAPVPHHKYKPVGNTRISLDRNTIFTPFPDSNGIHQSKTYATTSTWAHSDFKQMLRTARGKMNPFWKFHLLNETTDWSHLNTHKMYLLLSAHRQKTHLFFFFKELHYHIC